jgi:predicted glutamine amidotransferase
MCGLVAVVTKNKYGFTNEQKDIFSILLYIDVMRGEDSTGVFLVNTLGNVELAKDATASADFIRTDEYKALKAAAFKNGWAMVGHNRAATRGQITDRNAHPFIVDDKIALVHNGTLVGGHKHHADTEVDSEAIAHLLAKEEDPEKVLRKVNGAYALIWYDADTKKLNFIRNTQRPLWLMETSTEYIFASEESFLNLVRDKFRLKPLENGGPYQIKEDHLLTFELLGNKDTKIHNRDLDCSYHKHNPSQSTGGGSTGYPFPLQNHENRNGAENDEHDWYNQWYRDRPTRVEQQGRVTIAYQNIHTEDSRYVNRVLDSLKADCHTCTYKEYVDLGKMYTKGDDIKVIVNDLTEATDDPKTTNYLFIGKPVGFRHVYSVFHQRVDDWNEAYHRANDGVFQAKVKTISWHRTESQDTKKHMDEWLGICIIHLSEPQFIDIPTQIPNNLPVLTNILH